MKQQVILTQKEFDELMACAKGLAELGVKMREMQNKFFALAKGKQFAKRKDILGRSKILEKEFDDRCQKVLGLKRDLFSEIKNKL